MRSLPLLLLFAALAPGASAASFAVKVQATKFYKGNLHAHSNDRAGRGYAEGKGDGDAAPAQVLDWYAGHGYDFAAVTDHNELTAVSGPGLTALDGIELTSYYGRKKLPVHVNAICVRGDAKGVRDAKSSSGAGVLRRTIEAARGADASLIVVNHPTYKRALDNSDLSAAKGFNGIELASGHPIVEKYDASAPESAETLWAGLLAQGRDVWAVAADDAHDFSGKLQDGEDAVRPPGKAWVQAWTDSADKEPLCAALAAGHFYASTGPELKSLTVQGNELSVAVAGFWDKASDKIEFLALKAGGKERVASRVSRSSASYLSDGSESYVRARVTQAGKRAWTQAYRVKP